MPRFAGLEPVGTTSPAGPQRAPSASRTEVDQYISRLRRQEDVAHEQRIDAGATECGDRVGRRTYDRLIVVERRIENERHPCSCEETRNQVMEARISLMPDELHAGGSIMMDHGRNAIAVCKPCWTS